MTPEKWKKLKSIFQEAIDLPATDRDEFVSKECGDDESLLFEVSKLVDAHHESSDLFESPAFKAVTDLVDDSSSALRVGQVVGAYRLEEQIGRGGMGTVYLASRADDAYKKKVAIKLIKRGFDTDEIVKRFRHERQILAVLEHPNITRLLDGGSTEDGLPFLVMDHVKGLPLNQFSNENKLSIKQRLEIFLQICSAIAYAHQNLIVHRDLKPSNILVNADVIPKILDFGISKLIETDGDQQTIEGTLTAFRAMTPEYASPEQVSGLPVTTSSDIYSLGVVLYELLTGHHPYRFRSKSLEDITRVLTDTSPTKPSLLCRSRGARVVMRHPEAIARTLRGDLDNIILMAMRKEPERRYSSVEQFAADIERYLNGLPVIAREDTFNYRASKFISRNKAGVAAGVGIAASLIGGLVAVSRQANIAARQRDRARQEAQKAQRINRFLQKMLASADPREAGKDMRVGDMLKIAAESIESEFATDLEVIGDLKSTVGLTYLSLGQLEIAEPYLRSALDLRLKRFPRESSQVAISLNNYGKLLEAIGDLDGADRHYSEALQTLTKTLGRRDLDVAEVLKNFGYLTALKGDNDRAIEIHEEELSISRRVQGEVYPDQARALVRLENVFSVKGNLNVSERLHRQALEIFRSVYGSSHPDIAMTMSNLVRDILYKRPSEAEQLSIKALAMRRAILGDDHPDVAWSFYNLAYVLLEREEQDRAEEMLAKAFALRGPNLPDGHPVVSSCFLLQGRSLMKRGPLKEAREAFEKCLELRLATLPPDHWLLSSTRSFLGQCLVNLGNEASGIRLLRESFDALENKLGNQHQQTRQARERLQTSMAILRDA